MRIDRYTKVVLTVIAVALIGMFVSSLLRLTPVSAQSQVDYSRLEVHPNGSQLVVYNTFSGEIDVLDMNTGRHVRSWHMDNPAYNLSGGN